MSGETAITVVGNLTDDPELKFTSSGVAIAKFRVASTPRQFDKQSGEFKDGDALFLRCTVWRQAAEHVAESLQRGARVVVVGRLRQNNYETAQGEKRSSIELEVDEIGPSLRYATAKVQKMQRSGGQTGNQGGDNRSANSAKQGGGSGFGNSDPWANAAPAGGGQSSFDDEPPF